MGTALGARWPRPGRRGAYLITMGAAWVGYGAGIISDPRYGTARGLAALTRHVPLSALGWVWIACGGLAVLAGAWAHPRSQAGGFALLAAPAGVWAIGFTLAWAGGGFPSASGSAFGWAGYTLGILWVSGLVEPPRRLRERA